MPLFSRAEQFVQFQWAKKDYVQGSFKYLKGTEQF